MARALTGVAPTDAERERVGQQLREAVGKGILPFEEFEARLDRVYEADTLAQLETLVRWLPQPQRRAPHLRPPWALATAVAVVALMATIFVIHPWAGQVPATAPFHQTPSASTPMVLADQGRVHLEITGCGAGSTPESIEVKGIADNVWTAPAGVTFDAVVVSRADGRVLARIGSAEPDLTPQSAVQWDGVATSAVPPPYDCRIENVKP